MAVKIISHVEENENGQWFIKLTDTLEEENSVICNNMSEYQKNLEEMALEYGNDIEVEWTKAKDLSIKSMNEINDEMEKLKEKYQEEIDELNKQKQENQNNESGFNPNA